MKVRYEMNRYGHLTMTPVSKVMCRKIRVYLDEMRKELLSTVRSHHELPPRVWENEYVQQDTAIEDAIRDARFTPSEIRDLEQGWQVTKNVDPWEWLHWVGWDAAEGIKY